MLIVAAIDEALATYKLHKQVLCSQITRNTEQHS